MKQLFYNKPALRWKSALPVGNGFTAAMIYGGRRKEKIAFNDVTLWSGYPKDYDNPESLQSLKAVRSLVFSGKYREATVLAEEKLTGGYSESFLPLGNLEIKLTGGLGQYSRALDLNQAILKRRFKAHMFCLKSCACAGLSNHRPALSGSASCKFSAKKRSVCAEWVGPLRQCAGLRSAQLSAWGTASGCVSAKWKRHGIRTFCAPSDGRSGH